MREFITVFGMRFLGLIDPGSAVYQRWRVPNPTAPYPQDYVIDQQGVVRYWNDAYDPKAVMLTIDNLLATEISEGQNPKSKIQNPKSLRVESNPVSSQVVFRVAKPIKIETRVVISDALGRKICVLQPDGSGRATWDAHVPNGVYFARLKSARPTVTVSFILKN